VVGDPDDAGYGFDRDLLLAGWVRLHDVLQSTSTGSLPQEQQWQPLWPWWHQHSDGTSTTLGGDDVDSSFFGSGEGADTCLFEKISNLDSTTTRDRCI
jgi:hypothetical protein